MKNLILILLLAASICSNTLFAQESIVFDKQYSFDHSNYIKDFKQTQDGGFICAGLIGFEMFDSRFLLFKTDSYGEVEFCKYQDSVSVNSDLWAVDFTKTGNYVGFGVTQENPDWHLSGAIVMYDSNGDTLWSKQYAFTSPVNPAENSKVYFHDGIYTSDNSLIAIGYIYEYGHVANALLVKTDIIGDTIWSWRYNFESSLMSVSETKNGDYIAVGTAIYPVSNEDEYPRRGVIVKISKNGDLIYAKDWNEFYDCGFESMNIDNDGNIVIGGYNYKHWPVVVDSEYYGLIVKTDSSGNTIWKKNVAYAVDVSCIDIDVALNNEILCLHRIEPPYIENWQMDAILEKYSAHGELIWSKIIGEPSVLDWPYSVALTSDGGTAFCGLYSPYGSPVKSWIVKTDSLGNGVYNEGWINSINEQQFKLYVNVYPNPVSDIVNVETPGFYNNFDLMICDLGGRIIKEYNNISGLKSFSVQDVRQGIYIIKIQSDKMVYTGKLSIKH